MNDLLSDTILPQGSPLTEAEVVLRTLIVYIAAIAIVRVGKKRFMAQNTAFDTVVGVMLGSILSRTINGTAPLLPTLAGGAALIALHWCLSWLAVRSHWFGSLIKGNAYVLAKDGELHLSQMYKTHITENDLREAMRSNHLESVSDVKLATFERSGSITIIPATRTPHVLEISVHEGVQTVRLQLS